MPFSEAFSEVCKKIRPLQMHSTPHYRRRKKVVPDQNTLQFCMLLFLCSIGTTQVLNDSVFGVKGLRKKRGAASVESET